MATKTKECPSCAMDVSAHAKECPICGYEFAEYGGGTKWLALLLIIAFIILLLVRL